MDNKVEQKAVDIPLSGGAASDEGLRAEAILVRDVLLKRGLETPMIYTGLSDEEKKARIQEHFTVIMETLGLDLRDDSLVETPKRIAKMYVSEIFGGLNYANFP